ncbi:hypothetical protein B0H13DRAFT_2393520 [Mycena leptocephala]|nr:hypothetical protein B0H13DRAFT_2393520 [Mycena leptocephala]
MSGALANTTIPADLRAYITSTTPLLADGMVVFAACSAQSIAVEPATNSLPTNTLTLDAMTFFVLPGSPDSRVTGSPQTLDDGHGSRAVTVAVSDFVHGETKASTVQLIFDFSTARWTRAPVPQPNTAIQFYGVCRELSPTGILRLKVDSTALNISSNALAPSDDTSDSAGSTASAPVTPSKRRKFDPTSPPPSVDSPDSPFASSTSALSANVTTSMGLYSMSGYLTFQSPYAPYNSRGEYTLPPSVDSRASTLTRDSDSTDISSASVAFPLTVLLSYDTNPSRDEFINRKYFAIQHANFGPTFVFLSTGPRRS